jgi:nickel-type superoxide dismutase maturation protease
MRRGLVTAAGLGLLGWWHLRPFRVEVTGRSMEPELLTGDYLVAIRTRSLRPGSLVVVEHPGRPGFEVVKRVAAVAGDAVDGAILPPGRVWVSGDNRATSSDSRSFGPVGVDAIKGVVRLRYWPPERVRWFG